MIQLIASYWRTTTSTQEVPPDDDNTDPYAAATAAAELSPRCLSPVSMAKANCPNSATLKLLHFLPNPSQIFNPPANGLVWLRDSEFLPRRSWIRRERAEASSGSTLQQRAWGKKQRRTSSSRRENCKIGCKQSIFHVAVRMSNVRTVSDANVRKGREKNPSTK